MVIFTGDGCAQCETIKVIYEEVARRLSNNRHIRFYWINIHKNEVMGIESVHDRAVVKLFAHRDKKQPLDLSEYRSPTKIMRELEKKTSHNWIEPLDPKTDL